MRSAEDWKIELRTGLGGLMNQAVMAGARADEVLGAMADELQAMKAALGPDERPVERPAEQILEEPANDWPGAER